MEKETETETEIPITLEQDNKVQNSIFVRTEYPKMLQITLRTGCYPMRT